VTRLRELLHEREKFFRFMVHELRAPLSPLVTTMAVLRSPSVIGNEEKRTAMLARMSRAVDRMVSFVDDFLDLSKLDQETLAVKQTDVQLDAIVKVVVEGQMPLAEDKGLALTAAPWAPFPIRGDPVVLRTVIQNLVNNAIKYTEKGRVELRVSRDEDTFSIRVCDTGAGLTPEEQKNLFQEFGRIKRMEGVKGTGLGLALVRKLVDACEGRVTVESAGKQQGSCFTVTLPYVFGERE
jgi:signal transduction histidine kinase